MTVIIIDRKNSKLNESLGIESLLAAPFFSVSYGENFVNAFSVLAPKNIIVFSDSRKLNIDNNVIVSSDMAEVRSLIGTDEKDVFLVAFSDLYFELTDNLIFLSSEFLCKGYFSDDKLVFALLSQKYLLDFFDEYVNGQFNEDKFFGEKTQFDGNCKSISDIFKYAELLKYTLNGNSSVILPRLAQGIYAENKIPSGDFVIIPPVYFADNVQIESGCVIGPDTVIMKDCLVAKNTKISKSIIFNNNYISNGCLVDRAICCPDVVVRRNSVVFSDSVLCYGCCVGEDCIVDNGSYLKPYSRVDELKAKEINFKSEDVDCPAGFYGYLPEKAALLGAAIGNAFDAPSIAIAGDGEHNSTALKLAILSGAMTTGAQCYDFGNTFLSSLYYFMSYCRIDYAVFVSGNKSGTVISVFSKNSTELSKGQFYTIKSIMLNNDIKRCKAELCKPVRQIHGMQRMYIQNLINSFSHKIDFLPIFKSKNKYIESVGELAVSKIISDYSVGRRILFNVNRDGTVVTAECDGVIYNHQKLKNLCSFFKNEHNFNCEKHNFLWETDALFLSFELIGFLSEKKLTLSEAMAMLPDFYIAETEIPEKISMAKLVSKLSGKGDLFFNNGQLSLVTGDSKVRFNKTKEGSLRITVDSASVEAADELTGALLRIIKQEI